MLHFTPETMAPLLKTIYASGTEPAHWQDFICQLQSRFPYGPCILYGHDDKVGRYLGMVQAGLSEQDQQRFISHYSGVSPFIKPIAQSPTNTPRRVAELCDLSDLQNTEYFNDFMLPRHGGGGAAIVLRREESRSLFLTVECDFRRRDEIEPEIVATMRHLSVHIQQSFDMMRRLSGQELDRANVGKLINLVQDAAFVLDAEGHILTMNDAGRGLMTRQKCFATDQGKPTFHDSAAQHYLSKGLANLGLQSFETYDSRHFMQTEEGRLLLTLCPLAETSKFDGHVVYEVVSVRQPVAVLVITELDNQPQRSMQVARQLFGLTNAECKLAEAMARGETLQKYAEDNNLSFFTARNQLASVFAKTNSSRQVELALLLNKIAS